MKALITGASSGIGREFARLLAARGWDLIVAARSTDKLYELRDELSNVHVRVITIDLSREQDAYDLYEHLQEEHIDMLINNAGFGAYGFFADVPLQREIELIHTNVCSLHILTKLYLQDMLARGSGTILNVGSMAGFSAGPKLSSYYASKNYVVRDLGALPGTRQHQLQQRGKRALFGQRTVSARRRRLRAAADRKGKAGDYPGHADEADKILFPFSQRKGAHACFL